MFKHILIPVDFSEANYHALDIALGIARQENATISVLHVIELIADTTFEEFEDFYTKLMTQARADMDDLLERYKNRGVLIVPKIVYGRRVSEIVRFASEQDVDFAPDAFTVLSRNILPPFKGMRLCYKRP